MFNSEAIKSLAHENPTAAAVLLALSHRERPRRILNLNLFINQLKAEGVTFIEADFYHVFKTLQNQGVGNLIYGRKGNPDVFVWFYSFLDIAEIGMGSDKKPDNVKKMRGHLRVVRRREPNSLDSQEANTIKAAVKLVEKPKEIEGLSVKNGYITIQIPAELLKLVK